ncbi:MAG: biotin--[acetyl-CoA-carboxylase] ligase [Bacteroidales bacterium]|nr:biotin--[acetyl-CoA-carboxylase] ligase [Bacteroidales bacterium]
MNSTTPVRKIGNTVEWLNEVISTNSHVLEILNSSHPAEGSIYVADFQTKGRGTESNSWESAAGQNLTFSLLLYPSFLAADKHFSLTQAIALAIKDFLQNQGISSVKVKWPNDIYVADKKICGILIQTAIQGRRFGYAVVGIGLNVNQLEFISDAPNPVSLKMLTGKEYQLSEKLSELCACLDFRYSQLRNGEWTSLYDDYMSSLYQFLEWHMYSIRKMPLEARITGISEMGQLLLEDRNGRDYTCDLKEIKYL